MTKKDLLCEYSEQYPLYPKLQEGGEEQAQLLIDGFKERLKSAADDVLGDLYCDVASYIESDQWTNYRNDLLSGLCNYGTRKVQGGHDFKRIRRAMFEEYKAEIIADIGTDLIEQIASLERQLTEVRQWNSRF